MKIHDAETVLKYCADIPCRIAIINQSQRELEDETDTLHGVAMDGMPKSGVPGDAVCSMACKMVDLGIGDRLRELEERKRILRSDWATIQRQIDRLPSVHNLILSGYYIEHKKWDKIGDKINYSVRHMKRLRNVALAMFGNCLESLPECGAIVSRAYNANRQTMRDTQNVDDGV